MKRLNMFKLVRDKQSSTGWSAIILMRGIRITGPDERGDYKVVRRTFRGHQHIPVDNVAKKAKIVVRATIPIPAAEAAQIKRDKILNRARDRSPMLQ